MDENRQDDLTDRLAICIEEDSTADDCSLGTNITPIDISDSCKDRHLDIMAITDRHRCAQSSSDSSISIGLTAHRLDFSCACTDTPRLKTVSPTPTEHAKSYDRTDRSTSWPYAFQGECPLSEDDCIRNSILYGKRGPKTRDSWTEVPAVIVSPSPSSSSSQVGYPVEEDSGNDGTYSIVEELPSDYNDENFRSKQNSISSDNDDDDEDVDTDDENHHHHHHHHRQRHKILKMYSDSLEDSRSSGRMRAEKSHRRVYKYLRTCLTAEQNIRQSIARTNESVAENYHQNEAGRVTDDVSSASISSQEESNSYSAIAKQDSRNESISYSSEASLNSAPSPKLGCQIDDSGETRLPVTLQVTENNQASARRFSGPMENTDLEGPGPLKPPFAIKTGGKMTPTGPKISTPAIYDIGELYSEHALVNNDGLSSHTRQMIRSPNPNSSADGISLASVVLEPPGHLVTDADLTGIILEPPCMFRSDSEEKNAAADSVSSDESDSYSWPVKKVYVANAIVPAKIHPSSARKEDATSILSSERQFGATYSAPPDSADYRIDDSITATQAIPGLGNWESIPQGSAHLLAVDEARAIDAKSCSGIATNLGMKQVVVKQGGHENSLEGGATETIITPGILYHLVSAFTDIRSSFDIWKSLSSENLNPCNRKHEPWNRYQPDRRRPPHLLRHRHTPPLRMDVLQDSEHSELKLSVWDTFSHPSQRLHDISQTIVATYSSSHISQYDIATIVPAKPVSFSLYIGTPLSFFSCYYKNDIEEGYGEKHRSNNVGDVVQPLIKWPDNCKRVSQEQPRVDDYLKNSRDGGCDDKISRSKRLIKGGSGNGGSVDEHENYNNKVDVALYISNLEAIHKISDYFKKSVETGDKQAAISDLEFDMKLETGPMRCKIGPSSLKNSVDDNNNNNQHDNDDEKQNENTGNGNSAANLTEKDINDANRYAAAKKNTSVENEDDRDQVTSFIFSSWDSAFSEDEDSSGEVGLGTNDEKKNSNASTATDEDILVATTENTRLTEHRGILKSTLKCGSKKCSPKNRVQFDENLNEFIEADYVILIPADEHHDDDDNHQDLESGWCECSDQPAYRSCYLIDFVVGQDDGFQADNQHSLSSADSLTLDFAAAIDSPDKLVNFDTPSPLDHLKNSTHASESAPHNLSNKVSSSITNRPDGTRYETVRNEGDISSSSEKNTTLQQQQQQQQQQPQQQKREQQRIHQQQQQNQREYVDDDSGAKKNQRDPGYTRHFAKKVRGCGREQLFDDKNIPGGVDSQVEDKNEDRRPQYIMETITTTTITERRILHKSDNQMTAADAASPDGSSYNGGSGILKGGKFWRHSDTKPSTADCNPATDTVRVELSDDSGGNDNDKRSVKFVQEGLSVDDDPHPHKSEKHQGGEFVLTFKLGNRVLPCNSLKPNSAVRQLFPDPRFVDRPSATVSQPQPQPQPAYADSDNRKYLVTVESLQAFDEVNKRSVFASATSAAKDCHSDKEAFAASSDNVNDNDNDNDNVNVNDNDHDDHIRNHGAIKKTIERNRLRRSLMRCSPLAADSENHQRAKKKTDLSLEQRIKLLTCDIEEPRLSTETTGRGTPSSWTEATTLQIGLAGQGSRPYRAKTAPSSTILSSISTSPTAATIATSAISSASSQQQNSSTSRPNLATTTTNVLVRPAASIKGQKATSSYEARHQFLSSLASATPSPSVLSQHIEPNYGNREMLKQKVAGDRDSILSTTSTGTEYSIDDIDKALAEPVVTVDTSDANLAVDSSQDELAVFVEQDAGRIERIKKRYSSATSATSATPATPNDGEQRHPRQFSRRPSAPRVNAPSDSTCTGESYSQLPTIAFSTGHLGGRITWPYSSADCVNDTILHSQQVPTGTSREDCGDTTACTVHQFTPSMLWQRTRATRQACPKIVAASACDTRHNTGRYVSRSTSCDSLAEIAVSCSPSNSCADPRYAACSGDHKSESKISASSNLADASMSSHTRSRAQLPIGAADTVQLDLTYPFQPGIASVVSVDHQQPQTSHMPYPVSQPIRMRLLATHHHHFDDPASRVSCTTSSHSLLYPQPSYAPFQNAVSAVFVRHHRPSQRIASAEATWPSSVWSASSALHRPQTDARVGPPPYPALTVSDVVAFSNGAPATRQCVASRIDGEPYPVFCRPSAAGPIAAFGSSPSPAPFQSQNQLKKSVAAHEATVSMAATTGQGQHYAKLTRQTAPTPLTQPVTIDQNKNKFTSAAAAAAATFFSTTRPTIPYSSNPSSIV